LFEATLKLYEAKLGRVHPTTINTVANLGVNYKDAGRVQEALPLLEEAYRASVLIRTLQWVREPLLDCYAKRGKAKEAALLVQTLVASDRQKLANGSPELASLLARRGLKLIEATSFDAAESLLRECLAIREEKLSDDWTLFNTKSLLGAALAGQQKFAEAEPLLADGYEGMEAREDTIPADSKVRLTEALKRLVDLYTAWKKPAEAARWQKAIDDVKVSRERDP
jgi:tetratricopeptide (TPR) repeat protein